MEKIITLSLLILITTSSHYLHISSSSPLSKMFPGKSVPLHSSAFGYTPKGVSISGVLALSNPIDACTKISQFEPTSDFHTFYLANSLNCPVSLKAKNIFDANGYAAIILKDSNSTIEKHGSKVHMPVLQIAPDDAKVIIQYIGEHPDETILTTIIFSNPGHQPTKGEIDLTLWLSSTSVEAYNFIESFREFYLAESKKLYFKPRYVLDAKVNPKAVYHVGCLSSGRYCAPELELHSRTEGRQVVEEDLRQIIISEVAPDLWFSYVINWKTDCLSNPDIFTEPWIAESCSNFSMVKAGIDPEEIKKIFVMSFRGPKVQIDDNELLLAQLTQQQTQKVTSWPTLYINNNPYNTHKQTLTQNLQQIMMDICKLQSPTMSQGCQKLYNTNFPDTEREQKWMITLVMVGLLVLMVILLLVYKMVMRKKMKEQIQEEVDRVLEQYYTYEGATRLENM